MADLWLSAPGFRTAHLPRRPTDRPLTICGRVMQRPYEAPDDMPRCHQCLTPSVGRSNLTLPARVFARGAELRRTTTLETRHG